MSEIVKYQNDMNKLKFKNFTQTDMNLFMALCSEMKENNVKEVVFPFFKIKNLVKFEDKKKGNVDFVNALKQMNYKLMSVNCEIITESKIIMFVLFPTFKIDIENETLTIAVNSEFIWLLNEMKNYTTFELIEFISLNSKYTKNLYRLLKQFRTTGRLIITDIKEFRELLDAPTAYTLKDFKRFVLDIAVKELQEKEAFKDLICEPQHARKRGAPVVGYTFTFSPEDIPKKLKRDEEKVSPAAKKANKTNTERKYDYNDLESQLFQ